MNRMSQIRQCRNWVFTDFELLDLEKIYNDNIELIRFIGWGEETCPDTNRKHLQGWIQTFNKKRRGGISKLLGSKKTHIEPMRGTPDDSEKYCKKEGRYRHFGNYVTERQRSDIFEMKTHIDEGQSNYELATTNFQLYVMYRKQFMQYRYDRLEEKSTTFRNVTVEVFKGKTGTNKTRTAVEESKGYYKIQGDSLEWWDGYVGQDILIIDEYNNQVPITKLLSILDGYQLRLPVKGGFTYAMWTKVIITTNLSCLHIKAKLEHREALDRRISKITVFTKRKAESTVPG